MPIHTRRSSLTQSTSLMENTSTIIRKKLVNCCSQPDCPLPTFTVDTEDPSSYAPCHALVKEIIQWAVERISNQMDGNNLYGVNFKFAHHDTCRFLVLREIMTSLSYLVLPWYIQITEVVNVSMEHVANLFGQIVYDLNFSLTHYLALFYLQQSNDENYANRNYNRTILQVRERLREMVTRQNYLSMHPTGSWQNDSEYIPKANELFPQPTTENSELRCQTQVSQIIAGYMCTQRYENIQPLSKYEEYLLKSTLDAFNNDQKPWYMTSETCFTSGTKYEEVTKKWISILPHFCTSFISNLLDWRCFEHDFEFINLIYEYHPSLVDKYPVLAETINVSHFRGFYAKCIATDYDPRFNICKDLVETIGGIIMNADPKGIRKYYAQRKQDDE